MIRLLPIFLLSLARLHAEDKPIALDLYAFGTSIHVMRQDDRDYNANNAGGGLGVSSRLSESVDLTAMAVAFRNSYNYQSTAIAAGLRYRWGDLDGLHASAAAMAGVVQYQQSIPAILPVVGAGYKWANVEATALPGPHALAIGFWLRVSIPVN